jgi:hypothetical protein
MKTNTFCAVILLAAPFLANASTIDLLAPSAAPIQEVEYTFFAQLGGNETESAQFIVPEFVNSDITIPFSQLQSCQIDGVACASVTLQPNEVFFGTFDEFTVNPQGASGVGYEFPTTAFDNFGTYLDISGTGALSVQSVEVTPTPEPASIGLVLAGGSLIGFWTVRRRRRLRYGSASAPTCNPAH